MQVLRNVDASVFQVGPRRDERVPHAHRRVFPIVYDEVEDVVVRRALGDAKGCLIHRCQIQLVDSRKLRAALVKLGVECGIVDIPRMDLGALKVVRPHEDACPLEYSDLENFWSCVPQVLYKWFVKMEIAVSNLSALLVTALVCVRKHSDLVVVEAAAWRAGGEEGKNELVVIRYC